MHSATMMDAKNTKSMVIYGGCSENFAPLDDVWVFNPTTSGDVWREIMPTSYRPPARWLHSSSVIATSVPMGQDARSVKSQGLMIYGGAANNAPMDDLWVFD